jgi:hypothetical protein
MLYGNSVIFRSMIERAVLNGINFRIIYVDNRQENNCNDVLI